MERIHKQVKPIFDQLKSKPNVEFEFRLGKKNTDMFDTNVGKETFEKLLEGLKKFSEWEKVFEQNTSVYYKGDTRMIMDDDTEEMTCMRKTKIKKFDVILEDQPYDVRFCASNEIPVEPSEDEVMDYLRIKRRTSFVRKNLSIDLTVVTGQPDDLDDEEDETYEVELEIIDPHKVSGDNQLFNLIYKIQCLLNILSD